jgi:beta-lactam-binding protein with PASTA domain
VAFASPVPVVPDVTDLSPDTASYALRFYGLAGPSGALGHTTNCPGSSQGKIVASDPPAGLREPFGLPVSLTVCDTPAMVTVPNVHGFDDTSARNAIVAAGLTVGPVTMEANCTVSRNDVIRQSPENGTAAPAGSPVSLAESTGRQPNGKLCVVN